MLNAHSTIRYIQCGKGEIAVVDLYSVSSVVNGDDAIYCTEDSLSGLSSLRGKGVRHHDHIDLASIPESRWRHEKKDFILIPWQPQHSIKFITNNPLAILISVSIPTVPYAMKCLIGDERAANFSMDCMHANPEWYQIVPVNKYSSMQDGNKLILHLESLGYDFSAFSTDGKPNSLVIPLNDATVLFPTSPGVLDNY